MITQELLNSVATDLEDWYKHYLNPYLSLEHSIEVLRNGCLPRIESLDTFCKQLEYKKERPSTTWKIRLLMDLMN